MAYQYRPKLSGGDRKFQAKILGEEPSGEVSLSQALNWYSRSATDDDRLQWTIDEMISRGYTANDIACVKRASFGSSVGAIARMFQNGCVLPEGTEERWVSNIEDAISKGKAAADESVLTRHSLKNPAARNRAKAMQIAADIDELFDAVWERKMKLADIEFFTIFETDMKMKPKQAKLLLPIYEAQLGEMKDPEVSHSKDTPMLIKFMEQLVASLKAWARKKDGEEANIERPRRGRKPMARKPIALTTRLKYQQTDEANKFVSIDPRKIIGASIVVLFNSKYKVLTVLRAATPDGLSVKGTTILNVDETSSEAKRAGRRIDAIREMTTASKTAITKLFNSITSEPTAVRTRTSEDIVLIRAI